MLGLGLIDGEIFLITSCSCSSYCWCSGTVLSLLFCLSLLARKADLYFCLPEPLPRRNNSNPRFFTMEESVWLLISICPSCIFPLLVDHFPHWLGSSSLSDFFTYLISFFYSHFSFLCRQPLHVFFHNIQWSRRNALWVILWNVCLGECRDNADACLSLAFIAGEQPDLF